MSNSAIDLSALLNRHTKVLMVMDVVESVRVMALDEVGFVRQWQALVAYVVGTVLPLHGGHLHKSLGDGLMLEFDSAPGCSQAAFTIQSYADTLNAGLPAARQLHLRMGAHVAAFVRDQHDIYGSDVNLTARICGLAGPGELVVSSECRDQLTDALDADIEDLGECHLKHVNAPIRVYRVGPVGFAPVIPKAEIKPADFRPTIAVIPFQARSNEPEHFVIGELIADGVIAQLSRSADIRVISRLSTTAFRGREHNPTEVEARLAAHFVLSGSYIASGGKILLMAELVDARRNEVVWADRLSGDVGDLLQVQSELLNTLAAAACRALIDREVAQSLVQPMPRLDSGALLMGGISMMHRSSLREFDRSRLAFEALVERHGRLAAPRAWLANWHVLRIVRGMSEDPRQEVRLALALTQRALDSEPENALTLAVEGLAYTQVLGEYALADDRLSRAIESNKSESMAWLFKSVLSSMWGSSSSSIEEALFAQSLSPLDPLKYFFELIAAAAFLTNNQLPEAIRYAQKSIRDNRHHAPTYRVLLTAQVESGLITEARASLSSLLDEQPGLTVSSYLAIGSGDSITRKRCVSALRELGLPE